MEPKVNIKIGGQELEGQLQTPNGFEGLVIFVGGEKVVGKRDTHIAEEMNKAGLATLALDLSDGDSRPGDLQFGVEQLTDKLVSVTKWCMDNELFKDMKIGYFGTGMGSAAALSAAAYYGTKISAVVSRSGRPDLTGEELDLVESPTLLIVGGEDKELVILNRQAYTHMGCEKKMETIAGADRDFTENEFFERLTILATNWFRGHL